jgi:mono/diheme cytochrome c family protein
MTKAQIWVAAFLGLFILLFFIERFTTPGESAADHPMGMSGQNESSGQPGEVSAAALIDRGGCASCHGADLSGTRNAPTLIGLRAFYDRDKLINYLRNPNSFMESDRFRAYKEQYKNIVMPAYNNYDVKDLGKIADYLLEK